MMRLSRLLVVAALGSLAVSCSSKKWVEIPGSKCGGTADCAEQYTCTRYVNGCRCMSGACYFDPGAKPVDPAVADGGDCRSCHGSRANAAPPGDLRGHADPTVKSVGAHQTHLAGGRSSRPVSCHECHLVPERTNDAGHLDGAVAVSFGALSTRDSTLSPTWDAGTTTCAGTYCHGAGFASPPGVAAPSWTITDSTQSRCGDCHGLPPPMPHPQVDHCELCHLPTAGPNLTIASRATHVDGVLNVNLECQGCHGGGTNLAPPADAAGKSDAANPAIGAHQAHVVGGRLSRPVACDTCHVIPGALTDPGHVDTALPAEVTFGGMALSGNSTPSWSHDTLTCAGAYCHGATLEGGSLTAPAWTDGAAAAACGTCHGSPPPLPHPQSPQCNLCHAPTAGPGLTIADIMTHVDGIVQASEGECGHCHGTAEDPAPPPDLKGGLDSSLATVGAHKTHLSGVSGISRPVPCNECHLVYTEVDDPGHVDTPPPAELVWGRLATAQGAFPVFDYAMGSCAGTYCHGATLRDGLVTTPVWNLVDGTQAACGTCHGVPPSAPHPADDRCELCHLPTAGPNQTITDLTTHIDGTLQAMRDCDACHGQNGVSSPPRDTTGSSDRQGRGVGAHEVHRTGGTWSKGVACSECHHVPAEVGDPGHLDPLPAEVYFGLVASTKGARATYTFPNCASTYCHAGPGATAPAPSWTAVGALPCDGCHGTPPPTPAHQTPQDCSVCHLPVAGPGLTIADRSKHGDGIVQVALEAGCAQCHGTAASAAPPRDIDGDTAATDPEVGAHEVHLSGGAFSAPVPCSACHLVPASVSSPGHLDTVRPAEVTFSGRSSLSGAAPVYDHGTGTCAQTYCHDSASTGGTNPRPAWNAPASAPCGSCHGLPPDGPHPQSTRCELCHAAVAGPGQAIVNRALHGDGIVQSDLTKVLCADCHGSASNAAPPADLEGSTTSPAVGAHQSHLVGTGNSRPVPCSECHVPVTRLGQAGHYDSARPADVSFGVVARQGGLTPIYFAAGCTGTWCHGATLSGGSSKSPTWTDGAQSCTSCHGMPPPDANHSGATPTNCNACHPDTAGPGGTVAHPAKHVDGVVDTSAACDACHGGAGDPTPPLGLGGTTSSAAIGAHRAHEQPKSSAPVVCATCHLVPATYASAGHADTPPPAEVILAGRAALGGVTPSFVPASLTCQNTYCHGATLSGGKASVTWSDATGAQSQCGACHGMPPADGNHGGVTTPNTCNTCHKDSAGPNQTITNPALHLDGVVQVSGAACDACHGSPPTPTREDYAGGGGAHEIHVTTYKLECKVCHGNNGGGATHNQGGGTITAANVNLVFSDVTFTGGTTTRNGQAAAVYTRATRTCAVGCHNPLPGNPADAADLANKHTWNQGALACTACHERVGNTPPLNHAISGLGSAGCRECHDTTTGHTAGTVVLRDADTTDAFTPVAGSWEWQCRTCHDGGTGTYMGGQSARNVSAYWTSSAHGSSGMPCGRCHTYHGSTGGPQLVDPVAAKCTSSGCHDALVATFAQAPGGVISHHRIEGGTNAITGKAITLGCSSCHNPHLAAKSPGAVINPDNRWATSTTPKTKVFCKACHDGTPPAGVTGAPTVTQSGADPTAFRTAEGHGGSHAKFNCQDCHTWHGNSGNSGIQRGRMLLPYINVRTFPYTGESSCGTSGGAKGCH